MSDMNGSAPMGTETDREKIRVFMVDDHAVVRQGLRALIDAEDDMVVVGEASLAHEAIEIGPECKPTVAVLDVRLPDDSGVTVCRELRSRIPGLACLMLTTFATEEALLDAILAGASGFVFKQICEDELVSAIRTVGNGGSMLDGDATAGIMRKVRQASLQSDDPLQNLTKQERILLDLIGEGLTNRQISERMFLSEKTVKNYVSNLLGKLGMQRRAQAAALAARNESHRQIFAQ